jgi:hypothetical protein
MASIPALDFRLVDDGPRWGGFFKKSSKTHNLPCMMIRIDDVDDEPRPRPSNPLRTKESWTNGHRTVQQLQSAAFSALPIRVPVSAA